VGGGELPKGNGQNNKRLGNEKGEPVERKDGKKGRIFSKFQTHRPSKRGELGNLRPEWE